MSQASVAAADYGALMARPVEKARAQSKSPQRSRCHSQGRLEGGLPEIADSILPPHHLTTGMESGKGKGPIARLNCPA